MFIYWKSYIEGKVQTKLNIFLYFVTDSNKLYISGIIQKNALI